MQYCNAVKNIMKLIYKMLISKYQSEVNEAIQDYTLSLQEVTQE